MPPSRGQVKDYSTVVSILPVDLVERKPGLYPSEFRVPKADVGDFTLTLVSRCHHKVYLDDTRPVLIVPDPSDMIANSICLDWKSGAGGYNPHDGIEPGLDWVDGNYVLNEKDEVDPKLKGAFRAMFGALLREMEEKQNRWFTWLVAEADDMWGKYHAHKFITPIMKSAANRLGVTARDWQIEQEVRDFLRLVKCRFCFADVHPEAVICASCQGVLNMNRYQKEFVNARAVPGMALTGAAPVAETK